MKYGAPYYFSAVFVMIVIKVRYYSKLTVFLGQLTK